MRDSSTFISPDRLHNSPIKEIMRKKHANEIAMLRLQLRNSRQTQARYKTKIETLHTALRSLRKKNMLEEEKMDAIEQLSKWN